jgi:hypothetical protein
VADTSRLPWSDEPYGEGRWICFREHAFPLYGSYQFVRGPMRFPTFGFYMLDLVIHWGLMERLARIGVIDAEREGASAFWRWDFWNAKMARQFREMERQKCSGV